MSTSEESIGMAAELRIRGTNFREPSVVLRAVAMAIIGLGSIAMAGCQRSNSLSGKVTYNGKPIENGSISFQSADGSGPGFGAQIVDGKYVADKVRLGKHVALIRGVHKKLAPQSSEESIRQYEAAKAAGKSTLDHYGQPADYISENAEGNSQTVVIEAGKQALDFALKGPPSSG
jgi:hypothetical protein